ncbi:MAG: glutamine amidotransferase [Pirellulales bacterium]
MLDPDYTNLSAAINMAEAAFPHDASKRIVIISDGNENLGNVLEQARSVTSHGIGIDVVPIVYQAESEIAIEKVAVPPNVRRGQPFDLRIVVDNTATGDNEARAVTGRLRVTEQTDDVPRTLSEQTVTVQPGKQVFTVPLERDQSNFYRFGAQFIPDDPASDATPENNAASAFTHIRGKGTVLLVEDQENPGEHDYLVERLRSAEIEVQVMPTNQLFTDLGGLQPFDSVVLADVPREYFSTVQIKAMVANTQKLGAGLVMLGGPSSFGAGGWRNTELEKAMPVDFEIKNAKVVPKGALALLMHASEIPQGNYWQIQTAAASIKTLGPEDLCGLVYFNGTEQWLWNHPNGLVEVGENKAKMLKRLSTMTPGDMPDFDPSMQMAVRAFNQVKDAAVKHMIIISDGDPSPPSPGVVKALVDGNISVSTVAIGAHGPANSRVLSDLAADTGGKYYAVNNARALPQIFQKEARRVARPLIYEPEQPFLPQVVSSAHPIVSGIASPLPPTRGYVMTTVKDNPLVEVVVLSPEPATEDSGANNTILATWQYGVGRAIAFTTDAGARWTDLWTNSEMYDKFFTQMIRWSMRPMDDQGNFTVAVDQSDGQGRVFITALDKDDRFIDMLNMTGMVVDPDMDAVDIDVAQTAPGRYVGTFDATKSGNFLVMVNPGGNLPPIRTGLNVPYSDEFRDRQPDVGVLSAMASLVPKGGEPGTFVEVDSNETDLKELLDVNPFRRDLERARSSQDIWYYLLFAAGCLFFFDVFNRRVAVSFAWVAPLVGTVRSRLLGREESRADEEYLDRLRSRKREVSAGLDERRAATRFEPTSDAPQAESEDLAAAIESGGAKKPSGGPAPGKTSGLAPQADAEVESYTDRLLKAKRQVRKGLDEKK